MPIFKMGQWNAVCNHCGEEKDVSCFYLHSNGKPRKQCKECHYARGKKWVAENRDIVNQLSIQYRQRDPDRHKARVTSWRKRNLAYDAHRARLYRTAKMHRIPAWANIDSIKEIYLACPAGYHVDHVVPLRGKSVSGLHVENNLQYLPASENCRKGNRYVDIPTGTI